jgi:hypothetical protein
LAPKDGECAVSDGEIKYIHFVTKAMRGFEAKTIAKHEAEGWELTDQVPGTLRTELKFRKPRPETWATKLGDWVAGLPLKTKAVAGAAIALVLALVIAVGSMNENDKNTSAADSKPTTSSKPTNTPTKDPSPTPTPTPQVPDGPLTYENNTDFQRLLAGDGDSADFASKYESQTIQYDAYVGAVGPGNEGGKDLNVLLPAGSHGPHKVGDKFGINDPLPPFAGAKDCPSFQIHGDYDVLPGFLALGLNVTVTATVADYDEDSGLFHLDVVDIKQR